MKSIMKIPPEIFWSGVIIALLFVLFALSGCAVAPLTEEEKDEREWRRGVDRENWIMCEAAYTRSGVATIHEEHMHGTRNPTRNHNVRRDLRINNCRQTLRDHWIEY